MSIAAQCPNCGAPIEFHVSSSVVTVCESCDTVVARADRSFEDLGKTSDLVQTQSRLSLWLTGTFQGVGFQLTGRAQLQHGAGGVWDEWYMAFDDGRWGWLAEAQGRFYLTFRDQGTASSEMPNAGDYVTVGEPSVMMTVAEVGQSSVLAGRGEIPYRLDVGRSYWYADLSGPAGMFGTIDYSETPPALFLGHEVSFASLGLQFDGSQPDFDPERPQVATQAVSCDNCGGSLELHAPDRTERVACPYCGAMHDCNQGVLRFLKLVEGRKVQPQLPLGAKGTFEGAEFTLIGFMVRKTSDDWDTYEWDEYLLYNPHLGFRWLVYSDAHWNFIKPVSLGDIRATLPDDYHYAGEIAEYQDRKYKIFQSGQATVDYVAGEFYWRVEAGQTTSTVDYVNAPEMLSGESGANEINWSLGTYMTRRQVDDAFADASPPNERPWGVGPNQPFRHKGVYPVWGIMFVLCIAMLVWAQSKSPKTTRHVESFVLEQGAGEPMDKVPGAPPDTSVFFSDEFELASNQNIQIKGFCRELNNSWVYVQIDLYNRETGGVYALDFPIEYYHGVSGGESWSEGSRDATKTLSSIPGGTYVMRVAGQRSPKMSKATLRLTVIQGVFNTSIWIVMFFFANLIPLIIAIWHFIFERRRWSKSDYSGGDE